MQRLLGFCFVLLMLVACSTIYPAPVPAANQATRQAAQAPIAAPTGAPPVHDRQPASTPVQATVPPADDPRAFLSTFDGNPAAPQPWNGADWDVTIHSRMLGDSLPEMAAQHGPDCGAPPATHTITSYADAVYQCRNHVMTAINGAEYGAIYLTPDRMLDFSEGQATIRFDMSTLRSSERDWVDVWITPFEDNVQLPLEEWLPDLQGEPRRALHVRMQLAGAQNEMTIFSAAVVRDFAYEKLPSRDAWHGYETVLTPDAARRDTFEIQVTKSSIRVGMPEYNLWWVDTSFRELGWDRGVVQFGHHSYNPAKCDGCRPNTWHWDNMLLSPSLPFTIIKTDTAFASGDSPSRLTFKQPAPRNAHLRFAGIGNNLELSFDNGVTWTPASMQATKRHVEEHAHNYWTRIPVGTQDVLIRGSNWWGGGWQARSFSIWAP